MPLYDYRCVACGTEVEVRHGIDGSGPEQCAECGGAMRKALSTPAIHFKGSGWAKKDAQAAASSRTKPASADGETSDGADAKQGGGDAKQDGGDAKRDGGDTKRDGGDTKRDGGGPDSGSTSGADGDKGKTSAGSRSSAGAPAGSTTTKKASSPSATSE